MLVHVSFNFITGMNTKNNVSWGVTPSGLEKINK